MKYVLIRFDSKRKKENQQSDVGACMQMHKLKVDIFSYMHKKVIELQKKPIETLFTVKAWSRDNPRCY